MKYILKIYIDDQSDETLSLYNNYVKKHNAMIDSNPFPDSGFDLYCLERDIIKYGSIYTMNTKISCSAYKIVNNKKIPTAFYLYPRSSISKTPLRLANSVGIIDCGYRGNIIAKLDNSGYYKDGHLITDYITEKNSRYVQICMPDLTPFKVIIVNSMDDLGHTVRGSGGFGSTDH